MIRTGIMSSGAGSRRTGRNGERTDTGQVTPGALVASVTQLVARVREAQTRLRTLAGADAEATKRVDAIAAKLLTEPVRYGKPGLQAHITYLAGMTAGVDQKIGRDAIARYEALKKELDAITADLARAEVGR